MTEFAKNRNVEQVKIPSRQPAANNIETVMKPFGKAMKIGNNLPHHKTPDDKLREARQTDSDIKKERKSTYNPSRHTVGMNYETGDQVLLRNYKKKSKFDPYYLPKKFVIMEILAKGYILVVKSLNREKCLMRHPNNVKIFEGDIPDHIAVLDNLDNNND